ncbi:MAG: RodZ domain-containing protein [Elusimicrobiaceae bacterium]
MSDVLKITPPAEPRFRSPGERLAAERKIRRLTHERIHRRTKIPLKVLAALENNDYEYYAREVYARSFLMQYCEFMGVDFAEIAADYDNAAQSGRSGHSHGRQIILDTATPVSDDGFLSSAHTYFMKYAAAGLLTMLLATAWLWRNAEYFEWTQNYAAAQQAPDSLYEAAFVSRLESLIKERTWLRVTADDKTLFEGYAPAGAKMSWKASREFRVETPDPDQVAFSMDNRAVENTFKKGVTVVPVIFSGVDVK